MSYVLFARENLKRSWFGSITVHFSPGFVLIILGQILHVTVQVQKHKRIIPAGRSKGNRTSKQILEGSIS